MSDLSDAACESIISHLLADYKDRSFLVVDLPRLHKHMQKQSFTSSCCAIGELPSNLEGLTVVLWSILSRDDYASLYRIMSLNPLSIILNCNVSEDTEWMSRFLRIRGWNYDSPLAEKISTLQWGCRAFTMPTEQVTKEIVSVVVPCRDNALHLRDCLNSILVQTYTTLEVVVVDDNSSDASYQVAYEFLTSDLERKHSVLRCRNHSGAAAARNMGLNHAVGDYVCCFDADDAMPANYIETALASAEGASIIAPRTWWLIPDQYFDKVELESLGVTQAPSSLDVYHRGMVDRKSHSSLFCNSGAADSLLIGSNIPICSLIKRGLVDFDPSLPCLQDWDMYLNTIKKGGAFSFFNCPPFIRSRANSISFSYSSKDRANVRCRIKAKYPSLFTKEPKILFVAVNTAGCIDEGLASIRLRAISLATQLDCADVGDYSYLEQHWQKYDVFYFVCLPNPIVFGWAKLLRTHRKAVLFDVNVASWCDDYKPANVTTTEERCYWISSIADVGVTFVCNSEKMQKALPVGLKSSFVLDDSLMPDPYSAFKVDYTLQHRICWCGDFGNITELLQFSSELAEFTHNCEATVRLITQRVDLRLPFRWEHIPWTIEGEKQAIVDCDVALVPRLEVGSFKCKSSIKWYQAGILRMPIVVMQKENGWLSMLCHLFKHQEAREQDGRERLMTTLKQGTSTKRAQEFLRIVNTVLPHSN